MKIVTFILYALLVVTGITLASCNPARDEQSERISFFSVPLSCGAAPDIGCGSRLKPLFLETGKQKQIKESWSNRQGTVIAIVWNGLEPDKSAREKILKSIFEGQGIDAHPILEPGTIKELAASLRGKDKWYKGMEVDQLSVEEAGVIAESLTQFAQNGRLLNDREAADIKKDLEDYFKKELVKVRTYDDLKSQETQSQWRKDGYQIYVNHIGKQRADAVSALFIKMHKEECDDDAECTDEEKKDCCSSSRTTAVTLQSIITCPQCLHTKRETMPTDACQILYTCENCKATLRAKLGDCCVFCSYGSVKCPSMQAGSKCRS